MGLWEVDVLLGFVHALHKSSQLLARFAWHPGGCIKDLDHASRFSRPGAMINQEPIAVTIGHRELHDPRHRQGQAFVVIEATEEAVQLIDGRATIPLCAFADQPETLERDARQINGFRRNVEPVHGCRVGDDHLDHPDIDPERHRARTLLRPHLAVVDKLLPVEVPDLLLAQIALERLERGGLAATRRFAYLAHIDYVEIDEIAEGGQAGDGRLVRRQPLIDPGLCLAGPTMGVVAAEERLARVAALSSDLDPVCTGGELGDGGHFRVRCVCNESS